MRVSLREHGGLAAAVHRNTPARVADTTLLPAGQAAELARLASAALGAEPGPPAGPDPARDGMSYTVTIEDDTTHVLTGSDTGASPQLAELVRFLQEYAR
ncbi:protealysin inhibitor emfourin [Actinoplanes sp. NPDC049548]|uniref:protealysin inhibitor emfourin n=1 Tax=Actinoplanes sp. NPDC049548 TaxID=3155152 RepID=UPI0034226732